MFNFNNKTMNKSALFVIVILTISLLSSCLKENMDTFGSYYIYMSKDTSTFTLKDTLYVNGKDTLSKDSAIKVLGVTRSGISPVYPAVNIKLKIDSAYMDSVLTIYNNPLIPSTSKSDRVLYVKNSVLLPHTCYSVIPDLTIGENERTGVIGLRLNLTKIAKIKTTKDLVFALSLVSCSSDTIRMTKKTAILKLKRSFLYKTITQ